MCFFSQLQYMKGMNEWVGKSVDHGCPYRKIYHGVVSVKSMGPCFGQMLYCFIAKMRYKVLGSQAKNANEIKEVLNVTIVKRSMKNSSTVNQKFMPAKGTYGPS
jgi:hypothetical protein